jgi:hypothetical protein
MFEIQKSRWTPVRRKLPQNQKLHGDCTASCGLCEITMLPLTMQVPIRARRLCARDADQHERTEKPPAPGASPPQLIGARDALGSTNLLSRLWEIGYGAGGGVPGKILMPVLSREVGSLG